MTVSNAKRSTALRQLLVLMFILAVTPAFAVTISTTGGCTTTHAITSTITFDGNNTNDPAGHATYTGANLDVGSDPHCGGHWLGLNTTTTTITFDKPLDFWSTAWGSADSNNEVQIYNGATLLLTYTPTSGGDQYVNFTAGSGETFNKIVLSTPSCCFEMDNQSYELADTTVSGGATPEPGSMGLLVVAAAAILSVRRTRQKV
jgi:hypothetical protein